MTIKATRKSHNVYPFSRKRALIPFERSFTVEDFERVKLGVIPQEMEDHWFIFFESRRQNIYFVRSWTGFCAYVAHVEQINDNPRIAKAWASRQYGSADVKDDAEILGMVIEKVLLNAESPDS